MQCVYCNNWVPDQGRFCHMCGKELLDSTPQRKSHSSAAFQVLLALLLLAISGVLIALLVERKREKANAPQSQSATQIAKPPVEPSLQPSPQASPAAPQSVEAFVEPGNKGRRITFRPGSTAETVRGIAETGVEYVYLLKVRAGQTMTFRLSSYNSKAVVGIYDPTGVRGGPWNGTWSLESVAGDYKIVISNLGEERTSYALEITIV